ncbi:CLUMA_CG019895, isoform A [Clunio marinus]|uniref:CLUMA_CG019895, isoform A n=1 Tax=Clunio marinus TaxID=568069 RepID=A0A1J1J3T0_9DIPT|nr:CLUMA_CG019895, isoform A [Clunio marinus]
MIFTLSGNFNAANACILRLLNKLIVSLIMFNLNLTAYNDIVLFVLFYLDRTECLDLFSLHESFELQMKK